MRASTSTSPLRQFLAAVLLGTLLHVVESHRSTDKDDFSGQDDFFAAIRPEKEYFVFVKMYGILGDWFNFGVAYHTETMFCPLEALTVDGQENFNYIDVVEALKEDAASQATGGIFSLGSQIPDHHELSEQVFAGIAGSGAFSGRCWVTGYAGMGPVPTTFDDKNTHFFRGPKGVQRLYFMGTRKIQLLRYFQKMMECGNWNREYYHLLYHNCNYYTKTVLKSLDFTSSPTFQVEKLTGRAWIPDQGYFHVASQTCRGTKCIGRGYKDGKTARSGVCDEGTCHGGGEYNPAKHTCSTAPEDTTQQDAVGEDDESNKAEFVEEFGPKENIPQIPMEAMDSAWPGPNGGDVDSVEGEDEGYEEHNIVPDEEDIHHRLPPSSNVKVSAMRHQK